MNNLIFNNNRGDLPPHQHLDKEKKNKIDIKKLKKNTITSLNEVECFLRNFHKFTNYIKLYKILK